MSSPSQRLCPWGHFLSPRTSTAGVLRVPHSGQPSCTGTPFPRCPPSSSAFHCQVPPDSFHTCVPASTRPPFSSRRFSRASGSGSSAPLTAHRPKHRLPLRSPAFPSDGPSLPRASTQTLRGVSLRLVAFLLQPRAHPAISSSRHRWPLTYSCDVFCSLQEGAGRDENNKLQELLGTGLRRRPRVGRRCPTAGPLQCLSPLMQAELWGRPASCVTRHGDLGCFPLTTRLSG